jgi:hypothetical protein
MTAPLRQAYAATSRESPNAIVRLGRSWLGRVLRLGQPRGLHPALVWPAPALVLLATVQQEGHEARVIGAPGGWWS